MSDTAARKAKRPLSPHLQVYKLPYNAVMSITGRAVGVGLAKAVSFLCLLLITVVWYPPAYDVVTDFLKLPAVGYFLLFTAFVIFFYLGNGVRHVLWDASIGVHHKTGRMTGNIALGVAVALTAALWAFVAGYLG